MQYKLNYLLKKGRMGCIFSSQSNKKNNQNPLNLQKFPIQTQLEQNLEKAFKQNKLEQMEKVLKKWKQQQKIKDIWPQNPCFNKIIVQCIISDKTEVLGLFEQVGYNYMRIDFVQILKCAYNARDVSIVSRNQKMMRFIEEKMDPNSFQIGLKKQFFYRRLARQLGLQPLQQNGVTYEQIFINATKAPEQKTNNTDVNK